MIGVFIPTVIETCPRSRVIPYSLNHVMAVLCNEPQHVHGLHRELSECTKNQEMT